MNQHPAPQPEGYVEDLPVNGRSTPRPTLTVVRHDLRFHGRMNHIRAACDPCQWAMWLDDDHDLPDLITLLAQHAGLEAAKTVCIETLARYGAEHDEPQPAPLGVAQCKACHATGTELIRIDVLVDGVEQPGDLYCRDLIACGDRVQAKAQVKM